MMINKNKNIAKNTQSVIIQPIMWKKVIALKPLFKDLGLSPSTLDALTKKGFLHPTPIQAQVIPILLKGKQDIIGQAATGTGKTAAFGLPIIEKMDADNRQVQALILAPTRELALQVEGELRSLRGAKRLDILAIYGGQGMREQLHALKVGVQIVVGTPGRIIDHLTRKSLKLHALTHVVLDEADEMLNMGFIDDVEYILKATPTEKRVLLFSATMPPRLSKIADQYMHDKKLIQVKHEVGGATLTDQLYYEVKSADRLDALCRVIDMESEFYGLVFCRTQVDADQIATSLNRRNYASEAIHGGIEQQKREAILMRFRTRKTAILVATDVAARGIDVSNLTHVVNYALPSSPEVYTHRIGRTGRAGKKGVAMTFIAPGEGRKLEMIQRITQSAIRRGTLPNAQEIIAAKLAHLQEQLAAIITRRAGHSYVKIATALVEHQDPINVISALLNLHFGNAFDTSAYKNITVKPEAPEAFRLDRTHRNKGKRTFSTKKRPYWF